MSSLILPRRFTSQPRGPVELDWNHPIASKLGFCVIPTAGLRDLVTGLPLSLVGVAYAAYARHLDVNFVPNSTAGGYTLPFGYGVKTQTPTLFSVASSESTNTAGPILSIHKGGYNSFRMGFNSDYVSVNYPEVISTGSTSYPVKRNMRVIAATTNGSNGHNLWVDGAIVSTSTASIGTFDISWNIGFGYSVNNVYGASYATQFFNISVGCIFNSTLSASEIGEISRNPWQLFKPRRQVLYFDVGGGTATTYTLTTSLSAAVQKQQSMTAALDSAIQQAHMNSASVDAAIQRALGVSASTDAAIQQSHAATATTDAAILRAFTIAAALDSAIQQARSASSSLDAYLIAAGTTATSTSLDAAVRYSRAATASTDAAIQRAITASANLDAALSVSGSASSSLDAYIQAATVALVQLDAAVQIGRTVAVGIDAYISTGATLTPDDLAAIADAVWAHPKALTLQKFLALK